MADDDAILRRLIRANPNPLDEVKATTLVREWLEKNGWKLAASRSHGVDVEAERDSERWLIEAKGWQAANSANQQGAFNVALGQCLRRMNRPDVKYSVAFSDIPVYRGLWERLPKLARERTTITCLFVTKAGNVEESSS